jgi:hypothetical protein
MKIGRVLPNRPFKQGDLAKTSLLRPSKLYEILNLSATIPLRIESNKFILQVHLTIDSF